MKALIVEGDLMSQCVLAKLLTERGHEVVCYENAEQATLAYQKEAYPLVFVDVELPGMDGLQFCRWLRSQPSGENTYIILAHSPRHPSELNQVLAVGASDFLVKPLEVGGLKVRLTVAERQMASFFREKELEAQLKRREQEADGLQGELCRAGESIVKEGEARREIEEEVGRLRHELAEVREAFDLQLKEQANDLCSAANELESATTFRTRIEEDAKRLQQELELQAVRHAEVIESLRKELADEKARDHELAERHQAAAEEMQARVRDLTAAAREADQGRQQTEADSQRAATAFARAQADWEERQQDLSGEINNLRQQIEAVGESRPVREVEQLTVERDSLRQQLTAAQEDFARKMEVHIRELLRLDEALQASLDARRKLEMELVVAREELVVKCRDYAAGAVKFGEDIEAVLAERRRTTETVEAVRREYEGKAQTHQSALGELQERLEKAERGRQELEQELLKAWESASAATAAQPTSDAARLETELMTARQALEEESARNRELEEALKKARSEVQVRLRRFAAALERSEDDLAVPAA